MTTPMLSSCESSVQANEALYGSMKPTRYWLLLEYQYAFADKAWDKAQIPQAVKDKINTYPDSSSLLIRQPGGSDDADRAMSFYLVDAAAATPRYYKFYLQTYDDLLALDFDAILRGDYDDTAPPATKPLFLICTNGKRDACCASLGVPLYNAMSDIVGDAVWQCSHFGGHRFAATGICFPHALVYGRLDATHAPQLAHTYQQGTVMLEHFRARAIVPHLVQTCEYFLRRETGEQRIDAVRYITQDATSATFAIDETRYRVEVAPAESVTIVSTTGKPETKTIPQFALVRCEML